jgi:hypothetical protein
MATQQKVDRPESVCMRECLTLGTWVIITTTRQGLVRVVSDGDRVFHDYDLVREIATQLEGKYERVRVCRSSSYVDFLG